MSTTAISEGFYWPEQLPWSSPDGARQYLAVAYGSLKNAYSAMHQAQQSYGSVQEHNVRKLPEILFDGPASRSEAATEMAAAQEQLRQAQIGCDTEAALIVLAKQAVNQTV